MTTLQANFSWSDVGVDPIAIVMAWMLRDAPLDELEPQLILTRRPARSLTTP